MPTISLYVSDEIYQYLMNKAGKNRKPPVVVREILQKVMEEEESNLEDA